MMKNRLLPVLAFCTALAWTAQVSAGDKDHCAACETKGAKTSMKDSGQSSSTAQSGNPIRLSQFFGSAVNTRDGQNLGTIKDVLVDPNTGQIQFVLLGKGAAGGTAEKLAPIPWQAVNIQSEKNYVVNVDQDKFNQAPTMEEDRYSELNQPEQVIRIYRFYEILPPTGVGSPGQPPTGVIEGSGEQSDEESTPPDDSMKPKDPSQDQDQDQGTPPEVAPQAAPDAP